jgi:hypothetical protein
MAGGAREASQCKPKSWQGLQKDGCRNIAIAINDQRSKRVIAFHEKAGRSQEDSFVSSLVTLMR